MTEYERGRRDAIEECAKIRHLSPINPLLTKTGPCKENIQIGDERGRQPAVCNLSTDPNHRLPTLS